jgi:serine/threonine-protein kinase
VSLEQGTLVDNRYVIETRIGEGGMAEVFRVRHVHLETQHALKVLTVSGQSLQRRLMQEGRVQAAMQHANIVAVTDVVMVQGSPGLVMEYITGPPMDEFLQVHKPTLAEIDVLALGIMDGVSAAHRLDLIHRDLKPANVLLAIVGEELVPKVADFGLVKLLADGGDGFASKTRSGMAMGTPAYMPPEQVRDAKTVDARADVWSLGAILYELVAGERCFDGSDVLELMVKVAGNERPHIRDKVPDLPDRMVNAIEGALTTDRDERIATVQALKRAWLEGAPPMPYAPWSKDTLNVAKSLGSGGEDAGAFLRRSFRSSDGLRGRAGGTAVPLSGDRADTNPTAAPLSRSDATFAMDDADASDDTSPSSGSRRAAQGPVPGITMGPDFGVEPAVHDQQTPPPAHGITLGPDAGGLSAPTLAPPKDAITVDLEAAVGAPSAPARNMSIAALTGVAVLLGVGGLAFAATGMFAMSGQEEGRGEEPVEVPAPQPEPVVDAVAEDAPVAAPAVNPAPGPAATPQPASGSADAPEPAPAVSPEPLVAPEPAPEPEGTADAPEPEPAPSAGTSIGVDSDVTVLFHTAAGNKVSPTNLSPGTYTVTAFFDEGVPKEVGSITVRAGGAPSVRCVGARHICKITE